MHIQRAVRAMTPIRYTVTEAAKLSGVSVSTLKRWKRSGLFVPVETTPHGQWAVDLYRPEDITELVRIKKTNHPGRKKKNNGDTDTPQDHAPEAAAD